MQSREVLLSFKDDIGIALTKACDHDIDAVHLVRAAQVVRKELFNLKIKSFNGSFSSECQ